MKTLTLAAALGLCAAPAFADELKVGRLQCEVSAGLGMIVTSAKEMECRFLPARGRPERYHGVIRKFGLDLGGTDRGVLVWDVFAPVAGRLRHALAGDYTGLGASATFGVGLGANGLLGGSNRQISLQPISVQTQTGLNIAAGVAQMELRPGA
jgi:hypothetical protein